MSEEIETRISSERSSQAIDVVLTAELRIRTARARWSCIYNYTEPTNVIPNTIWVGSMDDASNIDWLVAHKITHVVNCGQPLYKYMERVGVKAGLRGCLVVNAEDTMGYPILENHLGSVVRFCDEALTDPEVRILFHCMAGINRSPALVLAYITLRVPTDSVSRFEVFAEYFEQLMNTRPIILENDDFYTQLVSWARSSNLPLL